MRLGKGLCTIMNILSLIVWIVSLVLVSALVVGVLRYRTWMQHLHQHLVSESRLLETSQGEVEYHLEGAGPTVLFLHGSPGGYDHGMAMAHLLNLGGFLLLSFSRPGYRRTPLSSGHTPQAQADLFASALTRLNISQVWIIALSGGGPSAVQFALRFPQRCRGVVMVATSAQRYSEEAVYRALPPVQRMFKRLFDHLLLCNPVLYLLVGLSRRVPGGAQSIPFLESLVSNPLHSPGYRNDMQQFADLPPSPPTDIAVPMLIVHGTADRDVPFSQARDLAHANPSAKLIPIEGANHVSVLASKEAISAIQSFVQNRPS